MAFQQRTHQIHLTNSPLTIEIEIDRPLRTH